MLPSYGHTHERPVDDSLNSILLSIKQTMESELNNVCTKIDGIHSRLDAIESKQRTLEEDMRASASSSTSVSPSCSSAKRTRSTPLDLQVILIIMHDFYK